MFNTVQSTILALKVIECHPEAYKNCFCIVYGHESGDRDACFNQSPASSQHERFSTHTLSRPDKNSKDLWCYICMCIINTSEATSKHE